MGFERIREAVGDALGSRVEGFERLGGGDINEAYRAELGDGRAVFVKTNAKAPRDMFVTEASGLAWLAEPGVLAIPSVLAVGEGEDGAQPFLVLELMTSGRRGSDFDAQLGRGLAALHRSGAPSFGLEYDNFIGSLPQDNAVESDWPSFYQRRRLEPQIRRAADRGLLNVSVRHSFDKLLSRLDTLAGTAEPPSRLHGDLWGGNLHVSAQGAPALIDPAVYGGHREMDLAMMRLFGGFGDRVFHVYDEAWPLADGWRERIGLYQLYPLMVHVNLFGGSYVGSVDRTLAQLL